MTNVLKQREEGRRVIKGIRGTTTDTGPKPTEKPTAFASAVSGLAVLAAFSATPRCGGDYATTPGKGKDVPEFAIGDAGQDAIAGVDSKPDGPTVVKTCAEKEVDGKKTYSKISLNGNDTYVLDGMTVTEGEQPYKVKITERGVTLKPLKDGKIKPYVIDVNGQKELVENKDTVTLTSDGKTYTVEITEGDTPSARLVRTNDAGVTIENVSVKSSDVEKDATETYETSYYGKRVVFTVAGGQTGEANRNILGEPEGDSKELVCTGANGTTVDGKLTNVTDANNDPIDGKLLLVWSAVVKQPGKPDTFSPSNSIGVSEGATFQAGEVTITTTLVSQPVYGDNDCITTTAGVTVNGTPYTIAEGTNATVHGGSNTAVEVEQTVAGSADSATSESPYCAKISATSSGSKQATGGIFCNGDSSPNVTVTTSGVNLDVTVTGVSIKSGSKVGTGTESGTNADAGAEAKAE